MAKISQTASGMQLHSICGGNLRAEICNFGARLVRLFVNGVDVLAGFDDLEQYRDDHGTYFGAVVGRVANRIGGGRFTLDGKEYKLFLNDNGVNHLHGGKQGFDSKLWEVTEEKEDSITLSYLSKDGEEGYPGDLAVSVSYSIASDALKISYHAEALDADTPCSLTNHAYFNLDGDFLTVRDHVLTICADRVTVIDDLLIPTGELAEVSGTPYDFTTPTPIGKNIDADDKLLHIAHGYDFNYVLKKDVVASSLALPAAEAYSLKSGIRMRVFTDRPCVQLYTGNFLDGFLGKTRYPYQSAFCLETQGYPNAVNIPTFESCILKKGEAFDSVTVYAFDKIK